MTTALKFALPSKGRLKEQAEAWLRDCGFTLEADGGERGYQARILELPGCEVTLLSASDIASALDVGDVHLGVTGEDVVLERGAGVQDRVLSLARLGFGRADLVVAAPKSWIDVDTMSDLEDVAHHVLTQSGRRLRVATKYGVQTRRFFAAWGIENYRIVDSAGATEGAPAAGAAELIVDITTTGATLAANNLKIISDGVILKSQANLAAALSRSWSSAALLQAQRLVRVVEARARAKTMAALAWPDAAEAAAQGSLGRLRELGAHVRREGLLLPAGAVFEASELLTEAGVGPLSVSRPHYVFETASAAMDALRARLGAPVGSV